MWIYRKVLTRKVPTVVCWKSAVETLKQGVNMFKVNNKNMWISYISGASIVDFEQLSAR